jgi:hypothetical protein
MKCEQEQLVYLFVRREVISGSVCETDKAGFEDRRYLGKRMRETANKIYGIGSEERRESNERGDPSRTPQREQKETTSTKRKRMREKPRGLSLFSVDRSIFVCLFLVIYLFLSLSVSVCL